MLITATIGIVFILVCFLFFHFKQDMLKTLFTHQLSYPTNELEDHLALTADQIIKNLESHITHLEDLLDEADERIELLDQKIQQAKQTLPARLDMINLSEPQLDMSQSQQPTMNIKTPQLYGVIQYQQQALRVVAPDTNIKEQKIPLHTGTQSFSQQRPVIVAMFKQGYTATEIAKATGLGQGEIQLFLQLHNND